MVKEAYMRGAAAAVGNFLKEYAPSALGGAGLGAAGGAAYTGIADDEDNLWRNVGIGAAGGGLAGGGIRGLRGLRGGAKGELAAMDQAGPDVLKRRNLSAEDKEWLRNIQGAEADVMARRAVRQAEAAKAQARMQARATTGGTREEMIANINKSKAVGNSVISAMQNALNNAKF